MLHRYKTGLYVVALCFELVGLILVGTSDVFPEARRLPRAWAQSARGGGTLGRHHAPPDTACPRHRTIEVGEAVSVEDALSAQVIRGIPSGTLADKVNALSKHDHEAQVRLNDLERQAAEERVARRAKIEET